MAYYVTHPNIEISALVRAPTTEKARTAFLDYLERQGGISRADRQYWRRNMVAERMESPEDVRADVELDYGHEESLYGSAPMAFERREERSQVTQEDVNRWDMEEAERDRGDYAPSEELPEKRWEGARVERVEELPSRLAHPNIGDVSKGMGGSGAMRIQEVAKADPESQTTSPIARTSLGR